MEVNGQPFRTIPLNKALDVLRESTHLSLLLKSNMMGFKEMLSKQEQGGWFFNRLLKVN
jgi:Rap guanine nucleotide exchange factor 2